jgi:hypothetical protein
MAQFLKGTYTMQKLTIAGTQFTVKPDRDLAALMKAAKAKPKMTRQKPDARRFPTFYVGTTSTMEYVREYWLANNGTMDSYRATFGDRLSTHPASVYDASEPELLMEVAD